MDGVRSIVNNLERKSSTFTDSEVLVLRRSVRNGCGGSAVAEVEVVLACGMLVQQWSRDQR
jgi:hypothetical protein